LRAWSANDGRAVEVLRDSIREPRSRRHICKLLNRHPLQAFAELIRALFREEIMYREALWICRRASEIRRGVQSLADELDQA
jgi:hypothetical protein